MASNLEGKQRDYTLFNKFFLGWGYTITEKYGTHVVKIMKRTVCGKEEFEEEDARHINIDHGFETPLQYQYLASI